MAERITFWQRLHERLAKLSNRIDATAQGKILGEVHARIPMVTADEQRALQLENAEADEKFWATMHDMHADNVAGHKGLALKAERKAAEGQAAMNNAAEHLEPIRQRIERIKQGEDVQGGLGQQLSLGQAEQILRDNGLTTSDIKHCTTVAQLKGDAWDEFLRWRADDKRHAEKALARKLLRKQQAEQTTTGES